MPATESRPRFCPDCRRPRRAGATLCDECGSTLADQGYCPTCERHWLLRPGDPCPKHDQPLADAPHAHEPDDGIDAFAPDWVPVASFAHPLAAEAARLRLEAEGIPTFLDGVRVSEHLPSAALGGVKLHVPRNFLPDARAVLNPSAAPSKAKDVLSDDLDDAWSEPAPAPDDGRRPLRRLAAAFLHIEPLATLAIVGLIVALLYFLVR